MPKRGKIDGRQVIVWDGSTPPDHILPRVKADSSEPYVDPAEFVKFLYDQDIHDVNFVGLRRLKKMNDLFAKLEPYAKPRSGQGHHQ
jgi:hypothetical protein